MPCIEFVALESQSNILKSSIVTTTTTVTTKGQDVDNYDFSKPEFVHDWNVEN